MKFPQELLNKIQSCSSREMVNETLGDMETNEKVDALLEAMGNPVVFFSDGDVSPEEKYLSLSGSLLAGVWRDDYSCYEAIQKKARRMESVC